MRIQVLPKELRTVVLQRNVLYAIIIINVLGTAFGFYYYADQLAATPTWFWVLVADSPIATFLAATSFFLHLRQREYAIVDTLAFIGNVKYGLWSVFVLLFYFDTFFAGNPLPMYLFLFFSHLGMMLQAFVILEYSSFTAVSVSLAGSWFLLNDFVDYQFDLHTRLFTTHPHPVSAAMIAAVTLTVGAWVIAFLQYKARN